MPSEVEVAVLTAAFDAAAGAEEALAAVLARYVVLTRTADGCRNVDLVASATHGGRFLVIEKWESADAVQAHLDSDLMAGHGRGRRARCSRRSPRSTSSTRSPPTTSALRAVGR